MDKITYFSVHGRTNKKYRTLSSGTLHSLDLDYPSYGGNALFPHALHDVLLRQKG